MNQGFEDWLKTMHFTPQMYFEDRIGYLKDRLKKVTGQIFVLTATESSLEISPLINNYQFKDDAIGVINELLDLANQ